MFSAGKYRSTEKGYENFMLSIFKLNLTEFFH